jgi:hypothetical protein
VWPDFVAGRVYLLVVQPFRAAAAQKGCTTMAIAATKSGHTHYSRQTTLTYPGGRVVDYNYKSGIDTIISRLSSMSLHHNASICTIRVQI